MVEETRRPGASVSTVARRNGVNANLLFAWKRAAEGSSAVSEARSSPVAMEAGFVPIEVCGSQLATDMRGPRRRLSSSTGMREDQVLASDVGKSSVIRSGVIEIELANGTRVRVDECVNERALRRVLAVLRSTP